MKILDNIKSNNGLKMSLVISVAVILVILAYTFLPFNEMSFIYNEF